MTMANRYGRRKAKGEFSTYGFGVVQNNEPGPADSYIHGSTEIDCRAVTPTGMPPEVQIAVKVSQFYRRTSRVLHGHIILTPKDAEALAFAIAPHLAEAVTALRDVAVAGDLDEALRRAATALQTIHQPKGD